MALAATVVMCSGLALTLPASKASAGAGEKADQAVKALVSAGLVRAEIVSTTGSWINDYRVDRGVVRKIRGRMLTLAERDGKVDYQVRLAAATQIASTAARPQPSGFARECGRP